MKYMLLLALAVMPLTAYAQTPVLPGDSYHMFSESNATEASQIPTQPVQAEPLPSLEISNMTFGFSNQTNINFGISNSTSIHFQESNSTNILNTIEQGPIPTWVKGIFVYWEQGKISDSELVNALQFLIKVGIINLQ